MTSLVKDIWQGTGWSSPANLVNYNGTLLFMASDATTGGELWKSDGTPEGTVRVADIHPGGLGSGAGFSGRLTVVNGVVLFSANDGTNGEELWMSDGTAEGTMMVKDINPGMTYFPFPQGANSYPHHFGTFNGTLFFAAYDGVATKLWKSDGTPAGTLAVADVGPTETQWNPIPRASSRPLVTYSTFPVLHPMVRALSFGKAMGRPRAPRASRTFGPVHTTARIRASL